MRHMGYLTLIYKYLDLKLATLYNIYGVGGSALFVLDWDTKGELLKM